MGPCHLIIPHAPVAKGRARVVKGGAYTPAKTAAAEDTIGEYWRAAYGARKPWDRSIPLGVQVKAVLARPRGSKRPSPTVRPDADNYLKLALDALTGLAWSDDSQIISAEVVKRYADDSGENEPRWEIRVWEEL